MRSGLVLIEEISQKVLGELPGTRIYWLSFDAGVIGSNLTKILMLENEFLFAGFAVGTSTLSRTQRLIIAYMTFV